MLGLIEARAAIQQVGKLPFVETGTVIDQQPEMCACARARHAKPSLGLVAGMPKVSCGRG